ncbi:MAG: SMI1/KNR4 family protein [Sphingomonas sp.]
MPMLSDDLFRRLQSRAADPERRTDALPSTRGQTVSVGGFAVRGIDLGALLRGETDPHTQPVDTPLAAPLDDETIAAAEARLGFALPPELRRLYAEVADGGFGPGSGLLPLERAVEIYLDRIANPPGLRGQAWPAQLLPITGTDPGNDCIDTGTGEIIYWDEEELADGPSDKVWRRSFKPEAPDLGAWLERWVGKPSPEEAQRAMMADAMRTNLRPTIAYWRAKTPEERKAFGLPETGWEQAMFGHLGIDLSGL